MTTKQLNTLKAAFSGIRTISIENRDRLEAELSRLDNASLAEIVLAGISFCDTVANTILVKRKILPNGALIDHAMCKILDSHCANAVESAAIGA